MKVQIRLFRLEMVVLILSLKLEKESKLKKTKQAVQRQWTRSLVTKAGITNAGYNAIPFID